MTKLGRPLRPRGRPHKSILDDPDRYAVALMAMQLGTKLKGQLPSAREAAKRAALAEDWMVERVSFSPHPPPRQPALHSRSMRMSPTKKSLNNGYREVLFRHTTKQAGSAALEPQVKRLLCKYRLWTADPKSTEAVWIQHMAVAWRAAIFPHLYETTRPSVSAETLCLRAAWHAGEEDFAARVLLDVLTAPR